MIGANEKRLKTLQKELAKEYKAAEKEMLGKVESYMNAFKKADAFELARYKKGEITFQQYKKWRAEKVQRSEWMKRMTEELAKGLTDEDVKAIARVNNAVLPAATEGSMFANFEASQITGKSYTLVSKSGLAQALSGDLYKKKVNVAKDMQWNERNVRGTIIRSLMKGDGVPTAAKDLLDTVGSYYQREDVKDWYDKTEKQIAKEIAHKNRVASQRDARTMLNAAEQGGKLAEYEELAEEGVDIEKGWMATLDERTRDSHAEMDMEYVPVDEPFSNGLMEPCDPSGDPAEVYNCRCTLVSRIDGRSISQEERRSNLNRPYEEWKQRSVMTSPDYDKITESLNNSGVEFIKPEKLSREMDGEEIINRVAGGDLTHGSCLSAACAYVGNESGLDVLDFRGGQSMEVFSRSFKQIARLQGVNADIIGGGGIRVAKKLLEGVKEGKEYMLTTGRHTAMVRRIANPFGGGTTLQYLELQTATQNGWHAFEQDIILFRGKPYETQKHLTMSDVLKDRFGCKGQTISESSLIDVDSLKNSDEFKKILGYINTSAADQRKGMKGYAR